MGTSQNDTTGLAFLGRYVNAELVKEVPPR